MNGNAVFGRAVNSEIYPDRGNYRNQKETFLAFIGFSIGLGNFWRFPYLCYEHGGATFLVPYMVFLIFLGFPLYFMEMLLGQYVSLGPTKLFSYMCPMLAGVGWGMVLITLMITIYYNMIIAWTIYYIGATFASFNNNGTLPWSHCNHDVNTKDCTTDSLTGSFISAKEYFNYVVLGRPQGDKDPNEVQVWLLLCLAIAWFLVAICLAGGIRRTGKILYLTVIYPYIILVFLMAMNYDSMDEEKSKNLFVDFFSQVNGTHLMDYEVWLDAATQVFYSLGVAFGGISTLASYNSFGHNIVRDAVLLCVLDCLTSILCGLTVFISLESVNGESPTEGSQMVFISLTSLFSRLHDTRLWALLFFFMILSFGLDSQFVMVEVVTTALLDNFHVLRRRQCLVVWSTCSLLLLFGIPMCMSNGLDIFNIYNEYASKHSVLLLGLLQVIIVSYIYGYKKMLSHVSSMKVWMPRPFYWFIVATWVVITPILILAVLVMSLYSDISKVPNSGGRDWKTIIGQCISSLPILLIPIVAIYTCTHKNETVRSQFKATPEFCPEYVRNRSNNIEQRNNFALESRGNFHENTGYVPD